MKIEFSTRAVNQINRFKYLTEYEVEDFLLEEMESEDYQDFLDDCNSSVCNEFYDKENNITIFSEIDFDRDEVIVTEIRRGNLVGRDFLY